MDVQKKVVLLAHLLITRNVGQTGLVDHTWVILKIVRETEREKNWSQKGKEPTIVLSSSEEI